MANIITIDEETWKTELFLDILMARTSRNDAQEYSDDLNNETDIDHLADEDTNINNMIDFMSWEYGNLVGYECLADMRKNWGIQINKYNTLQERHYKIQKARYEECKCLKKYFTHEDRKFIELHKSLNEQHMAARWAASEYRETISEIIDAAFPNAPIDLGWDEVWEEPVA